MTAPFAPPLTRLQLAVTGGLLLFVVAGPFGRREDFVGRIAFTYVCGFAIFLWALLTYRLCMRYREWLRNRRD